MRSTRPADLRARLGPKQKRALYAIRTMKCSAALAALDAADGGWTRVTLRRRSATCWRVYGLPPIESGQ